MNEDALARLLDERFAGFSSHLDARVDVLSTELNGRLDKFYAYSSGEVAALRQSVEELYDEVRSGIDRINSNLDTVRGMLDADELERGAMNVQLARHEDWIARAAPKTSIRYGNKPA